MKIQFDIKIEDFDTLLNDENSSYQTFDLPFHFSVSHDLVYSYFKTTLSIYRPIGND